MNIQHFHGVPPLYTNTFLIITNAKHGIIIDAAAEPAQASAPALEQAAALAWVQAPALQQVLALALSHNRDLRIAWANIEKARAQYGVQRADQLPTIAASGQASRSRTSTGNAAITSSQFSAQIGFTSY